MSSSWDRARQPRAELVFDDEMSPVAVAFVWTAENGRVQLRDYLTLHGLPGDQLPVLEPVLRGVSHAGTVLAGTEDSAMSTGSFVVELGVPLPALGGGAWVLLGIVLGVVGLRAVGESRRPRSALHKGIAIH